MIQWERQEFQPLRSLQCGQKDSRDSGKQTEGFSGTRMAEEVVSGSKVMTSTS